MIYDLGSSVELPGWVQRPLSLIPAIKVSGRELAHFTLPRIGGAAEEEEEGTVCFGFTLGSRDSQRTAAAGERCVYSIDQKLWILSWVFPVASIVLYV